MTREELLQEVLESVILDLDFLDNINKKITKETILDSFQVNLRNVASDYSDEIKAQFKEIVETFKKNISW